MGRKIATIVFLIIIIFIGLSYQSVFADELEDINKKLSDLQRALTSSEVATATNEKQLSDLTEQLDRIKKQVEKIEKDIIQKEQDIKKAEEKLTRHKRLLDERIVSFYKQKGKSRDIMLQILVSNSVSMFLKQFAYQQNLLNSDRETIVRVVLLVRDIEEKKSILENEKIRLEPIKDQIAKQSSFLEKEVLSAKNYQQTLKSTILTLTARQRSILSQRLAGLNLPQSLGAGPLICSDDRNRNPGFGNAFAFYTFGIPHRVGMSQYGANGRANSGQNHEDILRSYFNNISFETRNIRIKVQGYSEMDLEEYLLGIYEMPNSFHIEALKAQVIAARSYAISYTNSGQGEICTTQSCQVYKGGNKGGPWEQAVRETAGKVMVSEGQVIKAWYSSTAGGYTFSNDNVWSGGQKPWTKNFQDGRAGYGSFQDVLNNAYDKDSPCMYSAQGWRNEYDKSAWLKSEEVVDIFNTLLLMKSDSSTSENLYQVDKPNPSGKETWDANRVKSELQKKGIAPIENISSISISVDFGIGRSTTVSVNGQGFNAAEFKDRFNLRAPANLQIVGPLYNVERK